MLSRRQQILLKQAQAQAALSDQDYRDAISTCTGDATCRSSTDPRLTDAQMDVLMSFIEAVYWRAVDNGQLQPNGALPFRARGFWASRNIRGNTTRDRYNDRNAQTEIARLESDLEKLGYGAAYVATIRRNVGGSEWNYIAALERTLQAKRRANAEPF